jgi:hypothetical protein
MMMNSISITSKKYDTAFGAKVSGAIHVIKNARLNARSGRAVKTLIRTALCGPISVGGTIGMGEGLADVVFGGCLYDQRKLDLAFLVHESLLKVIPRRNILRGGRTLHALRSVEMTRVGSIVSERRDGTAILSTSFAC